jgi:hypothetical protein
VIQRFLRAGLLCLLGSFVVAAPPAFATSVVAPSFETMVDRAELIFTGRMAGQRCEWRQMGGQQSIVTLVTFEVISVHKGRPGRSIELQFLGGKIGNISLDVTEMPRFQANERVVLFVEGNGVNASPLVGFHHGRFKLERDPTGREIITDNRGAITDVAQIGKESSAVRGSLRAISHDDFAARIRETSSRRK